MLTELAITNLGVIDEATLTPARGLTALTGETGAGKTMIVSGLGLVSGGKADSGLVRRGADKAIVEARFAPVSPDIAARTESVGGELDAGELLIRRQISQGRSRAWLGGAQAPAQTVADVAGELVTLHGQSEQIRLGTAERQRQVLDRAAGPQLAEALARYRTNWEQRRVLSSELSRLVSDDQARNRQIDLLKFGLAEITKIDPQPGEDVELTAEAQKLQAADELRLAAATALAALVGDEQGDEPGAGGLVSAAHKGLVKTQADPALEARAARLAEIGYAIADEAQELASYLADLDADPIRLTVISERRGDLQHLTRKYGDTVDDVLAWAQHATAELDTLTSADDRIEALRAQIDALTEHLHNDAEIISTQRRQAAAHLAEAVLGELKALAMPHARLEFQLQPLPELGPFGAESVALLFSANPGSSPGPLAKVASGGELSRVRLALEVVLAAADEGQTFIFDEVDAGVGGATALEIGRRLAMLAERAQVLVVTHLAQVAAFADAHFVVAKSSDGQVTTSGIVEVQGEEREAELARMMGGLEDAESARAHARDLLKEAAR